MMCCDLYRESLRHHNFECARWCARADKEAYRPMSHDEAVAFLRDSMRDESPIATAVFTRTDGETVTLDHVNIDSIGPSAERPGVIGVEFTNDADRVVHLPFIASWEISYRFA